MRKVLIGLGVMLSLGLFSACSSDEGNELFKVRNFANSGCKSATRVGDEGGTLYDENEAIEVKGLKDGYLSINHKNALFNCEAGGFNIIATIDGNVIKVTEKYNADAANCICPYDIYCEVGPLADGDYTIIIYQDATYDQADAREHTRFNVSYKKDLNRILHIVPDPMCTT